MMIKFYFSIAISILLNTSLLVAQQQNYTQTEAYLNTNAFWAWYNNNGLDFSQGTPMHTRTAIQKINTIGIWSEGIAAVSDPITGDLLFYTDGRSVFNKHHNLMSNGDSLYGNFNRTAVQGVLIIPVIGNSSQYYIFSLGCHSSGFTNPYKGLYYNIVDMNLNNGDGDVIANAKNIPIDTNTTFNEAMISIPGNNCNVWLLVHEAETKTYRAYEVSESGINNIPITSEGIYTSLYAGHHLSVSPDRSKIMMTDYRSSFYFDIILNEGPIYSELSEFDPNNGTISNSISIVPQFSLPGIPDNYHFCGAYTSSFSPNSNVLYFIQRSEVEPYHSLLVQLDLSQYDSASINSSHTIIDTVMMGYDQSYPNGLKSYNDSIYIFYSNFGPNGNSLGRINRPDILGMGCSFQKTGIQLPTGYTSDSTVNVPNEVVYAFGAHEEVVLDTAMCSNYSLLPAYTQKSSNHIWNDNSTDTFLSIQGPGVYWVKYNYFSNNCIYNRTDTFKIRRGSVYPPPIINVYNTNVLGTTASYDSYQWMLNGETISGAIDSIYTASINGDYQVIVTDDFGCIDTSEIYKVTNQTNIHQINNKNIKIYPNPTKEFVYIEYESTISYSLFQIDGKEITTYQDGKKIDMRSLSSGLYLLKIYNENGQIIHFQKIYKAN